MLFLFDIEKSTVKKLPKLRSKLVAPLNKEPNSASDKPTNAAEVEKQQPQDEQEIPAEPVPSTGSTSQTIDSRKKVDNVPEKSEVCDELVTEVSKMIGEIANFYGSGATEYSTATDDNKTSQSGLVVSSPPEVSSEQITVTSLPSYAPERCLEAESSYQDIPQKPVKSDKPQPLADTGETPDVSAGQCSGKVTCCGGDGLSLFSVC